MQDIGSKRQVQYLVACIEERPVFIRVTDICLVAKAVKKSMPCCLAQPNRCSRGVYRTRPMKRSALSSDNSLPCMLLSHPNRFAKDNLRDRWTATRSDQTCRSLP